ncbi:hypothetical protein [Sagittula sp. SSi028]|uniref:hypothetical protein n=1 Tax=Sagittula sp. SSi028 TaxID=3400636 RepID=UPI003AF417CB
MARPYQIFSAQRLVVAQSTGTATAQAMTTEAVNMFDQHPEHHGFNSLVDLRRSRFPDDFSAEVRAAVRRMEPVYRARTGLAKTALVSGDDTTYGMTRMYQATVLSRLPDYDIEVFDDMRQALRYLGVSDGDIPDVLAALDVAGDQTEAALPDQL